MRLLLSAVYFCITLASALRVNEPAVVMSRDNQTCGDPSDVVPYYQHYSSAVTDYYYTADAALVNTVITSYHYTFQRVAGLVFITQQPSTVPFYRLYLSSGVDFYTTNTTERDIAIKQGYAEGDPTDPLTYIYPTEICGAVPFYRIYKSSQQATYYTTSESEKLDFIANQGYVDQGIAGYILPLVPSQCT
ncbi:hypothetical protein MVEN_01302200 [Mycena venus]|uniref:DUF5648 domain-containing protein n=1 Tax=Mycena venus TaxID=2733690 RepID=A0A8H7CVY8_9AGAR|nr:hypothetical protein MVEN_01302200 [Mycena venus]